LGAKIQAQNVVVEVNSISEESIGNSEIFLVAFNLSLSVGDSEKSHFGEQHLASENRTIYARAATLFTFVNTALLRSIHRFASILSRVSMFSNWDKGKEKSELKNFTSCCAQQPDATSSIEKATFSVLGMVR
jgi:hypothetical protein